MEGDRVSAMEFGKVLERLNQQDRQIAEMRSDIRDLLALANRGKGSIAMMISLGAIISTIIGWFIGRWLH